MSNSTQHAEVGGKSINQSINYNKSKKFVSSVVSVDNMLTFSKIFRNERCIFNTNHIKYNAKFT